jgi:predicted DNA-binding transcriptional regulator AlpA
MASDQVRVPRLLRLKEVEKLTGIERWRLYELFAAGNGPPHLRVGKVIRVPEDALVKWIEERIKQTRGEQ